MMTRTKHEETKEHGGHLHEGGRLVHFHQHTEELPLKVKDDLGIDFVTTLMTLIMTMMKMMTMPMMTNTCLPGTLPGSKIQAGCPQVASIRGHLCQDEDVDDNTNGLLEREPDKNY